MKKWIKIITVFILFIIIGALIYINYFSPLIISNMDIEITKPNELVYEPDMEDHLSIIRSIKSGDANKGYQLVRDSDDLPSNSKNDYIYLAIQFNVKNLSFFNQQNIDGFFANTSKNSRIIYKKSFDIKGNVGKFKKNRISAVYNAVMYRKGMSDKEVMEYIKKEDIRLEFSNIIRGSMKMNVSLAGVTEEKINNEPDFSRVNRLAVYYQGKKMVTESSDIIAKMFPKNCKYERNKEYKEVLAGSYIFFAYDDEEKLYMIYTLGTDYIGINGISYKVKNAPDYSKLYREIISEGSER